MATKEHEDGWEVGMKVERDIDGTWFPARIETVDARNRTVELFYLDDENQESDVPFEEIRHLRSDAASFRPAVVATLPRPLQGLIEDDEEIRKKHQPRVVVHDGHELPEGNLWVWQTTRTDFACNN
jgi:hypothetical protein